MKIALMTEQLLKYMDTESALRLIKEMGFDAADVTLFSHKGVRYPNPDFFNGDYIENAKRIKKVADKIGISLIQSHTCFPIHIEGKDKYNRDMFDIQRKSIEICGILGIKNVVIHPCNNWSVEKNTEFYKKLLPTAKKWGVTICTENMWNWDFIHDHALIAACSTPNNFLELIESVNDKNFKACVDVGHANMFSMVDKSITPANMVKTLNKHIACFHIHDNDGVRDNHETPFTMSLDWDSLIKAIKEIDYRGDLVIEICSKKFWRLNKSIERWKLELETGKKLRKLILEDE